MRKHYGWAMPVLFVAGIATATAQTCRDHIPAYAPDGRFSDNGDGTVTDAATGLIWKQCAEGLSGAGCVTGSAVALTWQQALQRGADAVFAGSAEWRLPNKNELASLLEQRCYAPAIDMRYFPNTPGGVFWSSSSLAYAPSYAWRVYFQYGGVSPFSKGDAIHVRLVRAGPSLGDLPLPAPTNVRATDGTYSGKVRVTWYPVSGATSYEVWRGTSTSTSTTGAVRIAGAVSATTYDDASVAAGTSYYFWVKACNGTGCSYFSGYDSGYRTGGGYQ